MGEVFPARVFLTLRGRESNTLAGEFQRAVKRAIRFLF